MPDSLKSRLDLDTVSGLALAIGLLPSDAPVPKGTQGYNRYTTQRDHWLGWLGVGNGTGSYERSSETRAKVVYNRIVEPKMLLWLIEAAKVDPARLKQATEGASAASALAGKSKAIRLSVPYSVVADAIWSSRAV